MTITPWAVNFPGGGNTTWSYSANGGTTYTTPAPTSTGQVAGPTGTQRFRTIVTIPTGVSGTWTVTVGGDIWDSTINQPARLVYDGIDRGTVPIAGSRTFTLPAIPGTHTVEIRIGQGNAGGITAPTASFTFTGASDVSEPVDACDCCPTDLVACLTPVSPLACTAGTITDQTTTFAQQHATPTSAVIVSNPLGYATNNQLHRTYDASVASDLGNWGVSTSGATQNTQITVRWSYAVPVDDVWGFSIWHGAGGILNDGDGVISADLAVYDGATLLFSGPIVSANGGQEFQTPFPARLNGVTHFELSNITKTGGAINMYIREVALNYPWRGELTQSCAPVELSAEVETTAATFAAGLTLAAGVMGQTNGPHTLTWSAPPGVTGSVITDIPGDFSTLTIVDGTVMTVSGNHNRQFSVSWAAADPEALTEQVYGLLCSGAIQWVDSEGNPVPDPSQVAPCGQTPTPSTADTLRTTWQFLGDDATGAGENICAVAPAPSFTSGFNAPVGGCYDPVNITGQVMEWTGDTGEFEYGQIPGPPGNITRAAWATVSGSAIGTVSWPNSAQLNPGQSVLSNQLPGDRRVRLTYLSGPLGTAPSGSVFTTGTTVRFASTNAANPTAPIRVRLDIL